MSVLSAAAKEEVLRMLSYARRELLPLLLKLLKKKSLRFDAELLMLWSSFSADAMMIVFILRSLSMERLLSALYF
jgi:hypothetical protein